MSLPTINPYSTGGDYQNWRFRVETLLKAEGLYHTIEADPPEVGSASFEAWGRANAKAVHIIVACVADPLLGHCMDETTAKAMWKNLRNLGEFENNVSPKKPVNGDEFELL